MSVSVLDYYDRAMVSSLPDVLFAFGDNMFRTGFGGQARACRGEPNAVGIPTKWRPNRDAGAYFTDDDYDEVIPEIDRALTQLEAHHEKGGIIVLPTHGIGTGLAELKTRAPKIDAYLQGRLSKLYKQARKSYR